jgi:putative SOS response-associated peptidase YedK
MVYALTSNGQSRIGQVPLIFFRKDRNNTEIINYQQNTFFPAGNAVILAILGTMCYKAAKDRNLDKINKGFATRVSKKIKGVEKFTASYALSAFDHAYLPVFRQSDLLEFFSWGFLQPTGQDNKESAEIKLNTANAKCETIFEKSLYREAIFEKRCVIALDGFFEWRHAFGKTYPHYIYHRTQPVLLMAGLWNPWVNTETGEVKETVSLITTAANPLMEVIHNQKKRMPLILDDEAAQEWLQPGLSQKQLADMMRPYDENKLGFHTVGRKLYPDAEETLKPVVYAELVSEQQTLF